MTVAVEMAGSSGHKEAGQKSLEGSLLADVKGVTLLKLLDGAETAELQEALGKEELVKVVVMGLEKQLEGEESEGVVADNQRRSQMAKILVKLVDVKGEEWKSLGAKFIMRVVQEAADSDQFTDWLEEVVLVAKAYEQQWNRGKTFLRNGDPKVETRYMNTTELLEWARIFPGLGDKREEVLEVLRVMGFDTLYGRDYWAAAFLATKEGEVDVDQVLGLLSLARETEEGKKDLTKDRYPEGLPIWVRMVERGGADNLDKLLLAVSRLYVDAERSQVIKVIYEAGQWQWLGYLDEQDKTFVNEKRDRDAVGWWKDNLAVLMADLEAGEKWSLDDKKMAVKILTQAQVWSKVQNEELQKWQKEKIGELYEQNIKIENIAIESS